MEKENLFGEDALDSSTHGSWQMDVEPQMYFPLLNGSKTIVIDQNNKGYGELGSHLWDAGVVLARYLENDGKGKEIYKKDKNFVPYCCGKNCIELGSGTGLTGVVAAQMGAKITMTDKPSLQKLLRHNVEKNIPELKSNVTITELMWGSGKTFTEPFDIILGADLTYDMEDIPILVKQLYDLSNANSVVILAYGLERAAMEPFFEQTKELFTVEHVSEDQLIRDDVEFPISTIGIVKLRKK